MTYVTYCEVYHKVRACVNVSGRSAVISLEFVYSLASCIRL